MQSLVIFLTAMLFVTSVARAHTARLSRCTPLWNLLHPTPTSSLASPTATTPCCLSSPRH
ncbi:hypothetical protein PF005_g10170 [Phytophthora fragariae]|uniref:RxLR effector protein n=1 Tax=Phytophthora fragariae TaxID=53985 RepID=A0A6A3SGG4_9STRA|nr:hypothetical protein PF003_g16854 [Phytophthora fragariae]KAE8938667.1 hypothetical protein PF009_g11473 [Phytophthora fragariae]KAE9012542.1 hypothetical protein PF011_g8865 [Phytophthora fragariae]KAE9116192.1 hypothetical protein PF007_g9747 [Phytophthora fragariae]KAE9145924.1 hypothetical protein PF006_g9257 [Phytophthora fragariae]